MTDMAYLTTIDRCLTKIQGSDKLRQVNCWLVGPKCPSPQKKTKNKKQNKTKQKQKQKQKSDKNYKCRKKGVVALRVYVKLQPRTKLLETN